MNITSHYVASSAKPFELSASPLPDLPMIPLTETTIVLPPVRWDSLMICRYQQQPDQNHNMLSFVRSLEAYLCPQRLPLGNLRPGTRRLRSSECCERRSSHRNQACS